MPHLISTFSNETFPFDLTTEFTPGGESLEVVIPAIDKAISKPGRFIFERFADFMPFKEMDDSISLGEGNTPILSAGRELTRFTGLQHLLLKNETVNPTWSFKDRGSLTCMFMSSEMKEDYSATISTGNMGHSISAYSARSRKKAIVFLPHYTPLEKIRSMSTHGAAVIRIRTDDYSTMKNELLEIAGSIKMRLVSGNGPIRTEGYKLTAFEMYEQLEGKVPDYIAVPSSACGHIRGLFKGYRELQLAGLTRKLPKMIVVQATQNAPLASAIMLGKDELIPYSNFHTIAEAITSGNPAGGNEIVQKAKQYGWLAEHASEDEIMEGQKRLANAGFFVEPAAAASVFAIKKLVDKKQIDRDAVVVMMLTGSGLKDMDLFQNAALEVTDTQIHDVKPILERMMKG